MYTSSGIFEWPTCMMTSRIRAGVKLQRRSIENVWGFCSPPDEHRYNLWSIVVVCSHLHALTTAQCSITWTVSRRFRRCAMGHRQSLLILAHFTSAFLSCQPLLYTSMTSSISMYIRSYTRRHLLWHMTSILRLVWINCLYVTSG